MKVLGGFFLNEMREQKVVQRANEKDGTWERLEREC